MTKVRGMIFLLDCTQGPRSLSRSRLHLISYSFKLISYGKNKHSDQIGACAGVSIFRRPCGNFPAKQKKILLSRKINRSKLKRKKNKSGEKQNSRPFEHKVYSSTSTLLNYHSVLSFIKNFVRF